MRMKIVDEKAKESLAMNLKLCRRIQNVSFAELAELTGISAQTLKNYEENKAIPNAFGIYALAQAFDTTVENLFSDKLEKAWYEFLEKIKT